MKQVNLNRTYTTRDGQIVTLISDMGRGVQPLIGYRGNNHLISQWCRDGKFYADEPMSPDDIIDLDVEEIEIFINIDNDGGVSAFVSKDDAIRLAKNRLVACVPVTIKYEPGQGL